MLKNKFHKLILSFTLFLAPHFLFAGAGNRFVYTQLKYEGDWDPYPHAHEAIIDMVSSLTNIPLVRERRIVSMSDPSLFETPFLLVKGNSVLNFNDGEKKKLKEYIDRGGMIFFDDTLCDPKGAFPKSIRSLMSELYPDRTFEHLSQDHAVFRSFFLLKGVGGRRIAQKFLEGLNVGGSLGGEGRTAVLYCANDLLGTWVKSPLGQYLFVPEPSGESQRWESFKLTLNIIYFNLTGTYKRDAIHQPFIERKLGR